MQKTCGIQLSHSTHSALVSNEIVFSVQSVKSQGSVLFCSNFCQVLQSVVWQHCGNSQPTDVNVRFYTVHCHTGSKALNTLSSHGSLVLSKKNVFNNDQRKLSLFCARSRSLSENMLQTISPATLFHWSWTLMV